MNGNAVRPSSYVRWEPVAKTRGVWGSCCSGSDLAQAKCQLCHSTDYIVMQPRGDAKQWEGVVTKMIKVFGAPLSEADARTITEYLARAYGPAR